MPAKVPDDMWGGAGSSIHNLSTKEIVQWATPTQQLWLLATTPRSRPKRSIVRVSRGSADTPFTLFLEGKLGLSTLRGGTSRRNAPMLE